MTVLSERLRLLEAAIIVPDANVLLGLYQSNREKRDRALEAFNLVRDRVWVAHRTKVEVLRHRFRVRSSTHRVLPKIESAVLKAFTKTADALRRRGDVHPAIDAGAVLLKACSEAGVLSLLSQQMLQAEESLAKEVDELLDYLLADDNVGEPLDQDHLDHVLRSGPNRMLQRVPPGWKDFQPKLANGRSLEDALGDLLFWEQVLKFAGDRRAPVVIVTAEKKEDWWEWRAGIMRPRSALSNESRARAGKEVAIVYIDDFVDTLYAPAYLEDLFASLVTQTTTGLTSLAKGLADSYIGFSSSESLSAALGGFYDLTKGLPDFTRLPDILGLNARSSLYDLTKGLPDFTRLPDMLGLNARSSLYDLTKGLDFTRLPDMLGLNARSSLYDLTKGLPDFTRLPDVLGLNARSSLYDLTKGLPDFTRLPDLLDLNARSALYDLSKGLPDFTRLPDVLGLNARSSLYDLTKALPDFTRLPDLSRPQCSLSALRSLKSTCRLYAANQ